MTHAFIHVLNPTESEAVQLFLFSRGYYWANHGTTTPQFLTEPYLSVPMIPSTKALGYVVDGNIRKIDGTVFVFADFKRFIDFISEPQIDIGDMPVRFDDSRQLIKVGCREINYKTVKQIYNRVEKGLK